jgi:hypothetical protein
MHETADSAISTQGQNQPDIDLANKLSEWLRACETSPSESDWRTEAEEDYAFYSGEQDDADTIEKLKEQKRPDTTYNEVKPKIDMLIGIGAQMKQAPTLRPRGQEDEARTQLMNGTLAYTRYETKCSRKEMECFEHQVKGGRSFLHFYLDDDNPYEPEIKSKFIFGRDVYVDPDSFEYDLSDARYIFVEKWFEEDYIKQQYPAFDADSIRTLQQESPNKPVFYDLARKKYRIVECWYRAYKQVIWFLNPLTQTPEFLDPEQFAKFNQLAMEKGLPTPNGQFQKLEQPIQGIQRPKRVVKYAHFSGNIILKQGDTPFTGYYSSQMFPYILFGAYKDYAKNKWFGSITMMKDPQRGLNTVRRQLIHLLQTSPKGILIHEAGAILNEDEYEEKSSEPNFRLVVASGKMDRFKFTDQPQISPIYGQLDELFVQTIKNVSGVQDSLLGIQTSSREPGVTVKMRQETGIAVLYILFANFKESRLNAAKILVDLIQQYVTMPKMIRIEGPEGEQLMQINTQMDPSQPDYNAVGSTRYDVIVDEDVENISMRAFILEQLASYSQNNPGTIPPELIVEYSNLPYTAKMQVKQFNESQQQGQAAAQQAEMSFKQQELDLKKAELALRVKEVELNFEAKMAQVNKPTPKGGTKNG